MSKTTRDWTVLSMLEWATSYFEEREVKSPRLSIEWLLAHVLGIKRLDLYLKYDRPLTENELSELRSMVKRRSVHEPLQYITEEASFYNCDLRVNSSVLIPRQETEQLVHLVFEEFGNEQIKVLDIGTGSGCIPIALKKERKDWEISAFDISDEAIDLAKQNAITNEVELDFFCHDLFNKTLSSDKELFDVIISNPPYILNQEADNLDSEVVDYEPHIALFCKDTFLMFDSIRELCETNLKQDGRIYLEVHEKHASEVADIFSKNGWDSRVKKDLDEKDRFVIVNR